MTMKGGTVLDSVKMLACMCGGCNIGLQLFQDTPSVLKTASVTSIGKMCLLFFFLNVQG